MEPFLLGKVALSNLTEDGLESIFDLLCVQRSELALRDPLRPLNTLDCLLKMQVRGFQGQLCDDCRHCVVLQCCRDILLC